MRSVTKLVPTPGVLAAYDEHACCVVDTYRDRWFYLTASEAWAWEVVQTTGYVDILDEEEIRYAAHFLDLGLIYAAYDDPVRPLIPERRECTRSPVPTVPAALPALPATRRAVRHGWRQAIKLNHLGLYHLTGRIRALHDDGYPYLSADAAALLHTYTATHIPWWVAKRHRTLRTATAAACLAAHDLQMRTDFSFGMRHPDGRPQYWCSVPEAPDPDILDGLTLARV